MSGTIVLVDTSGSMSLPVGSIRRIDALTNVLRRVLPAVPNARLISFNSIVTELTIGEAGAQLPEPEGGTDLHLALEHIAYLEPARIVVISDGEPSDPRAAIAAARVLGCVIHTHYVGDETNRAAIAFLRDLALCSNGGIGRPSISDLRRPEKLTAELRLLLAGPGG